MKLESSIDLRVTVLIDQLSFIRRLRRRQTYSEKLLWYQLKNRALKRYKFRRQVPFGRYVVDFYCPELKLVIELDGDSHDDRQEYDASRDSYLRSIGLHVMRFKNDVLYEEPEKIHEEILDYAYNKYLREIPSPCPSPALGRGDSGTFKMHEQSSSCETATHMKENDF